MSKVVKGIGRAIGKVVKGVVKVVKKVAKSKIGKVLIAAAAIYFGGAALTGLMGSSGAAAAGGLSGISGAAANISAAWSSLGTAASSLLGGNFATAGNAVSAGWGGSAATVGADGALLVNGAAPVASTVAPAAGGAPTITASAPPVDPTWTNVNGLNVLSEEAASKGLINGAQAGNSNFFGNLWNGMGDRAKGAAIAGGFQLVGGVMNGYGAQKQQQHQEEMDAAARDRYNSNIGTRLWA